MPTKLESVQARVREMEDVAYGHDERTDSWMNTWAFQARRELRRRRRKTPQASPPAGRPQPTS
jgi:hypothetical protein